MMARYFVAALSCILLVSVVSVDPMRRQRSRSLVQVEEEPRAEVPHEDIFDAGYGRMLRYEYSLSMSMTTAPVGFPTPEPSRVLPSDIPSLLPRSAEPSGNVIVSDFPSLAPSSVPTEVAASPSPTKSAVVHTLFPSSSPMEAVSPSPTAVSHTLFPSFVPTGQALSDAPSLTPSALPTVGSVAPTEIPDSDALAPSSFPSSNPTEISASNAPSISLSAAPTDIPDVLAPSSSPSSLPTVILASDAPSASFSSAPTEIPDSDVLAPSSSPSSFPSEIPASDVLAPSSSPTVVLVSDTPSASFSLAPTEIPASDALAPSSSPSSRPTEIPASDALAPSLSPSSAPSAGLLLRRQRSRSLLTLHDADKAAGSFEKTNVFDLEYGRMLTDVYFSSMSMTNAPVAPTSEPTKVLPSDIPSLLPRSAEPSDTVITSDFPSLSPSESPSVAVVSHTAAPSSLPTYSVASPSPTKPTGSHTLVPSSNPTEIPASDALAPSSSPSAIPASDALAPSSSPSSFPVQIPATDALAPSSSPSSVPSAGSFLRRQRSRTLLTVTDSEKIEFSLEDTSVFDSEYGRVLSDEHYLSMSMTRAPAATPRPTPDLPSDFPSLAPKSVQPSGGHVFSDFPSLSPSDAPTEPVASHTADPTAIPSSDVLAPSWSTSSIPTLHSGTPGQRWLQVGQPIVPLWEGLLGTDMAMSADGSVIAIGTPGNAPGHIGVYRYNETASVWDDVGGEIFDTIGEGSVRFGSSVAISADGMTVAGGSGYSRSVPDINGLSNPLAGRAQVNMYENGRWVQKGQSIVGTQCRSLGWSTALSGDGNRWVIGTPDVAGSGDARCNDIDYGSKRGIVQVFDFVNGGEWAQVGSVITGSQPGSQLGQAVAISRNGLRVAAFSQGTTDTDPYYQVFEQDAFGSWVQMGGNIVVESTVATSSTNTLALSASGSRVVVTNKRRDSGIGYFKVLEWIPETSSWTQMGEDVEDFDNCCFFFAYDTSVAMSDYGTKIVYGNTGYRDATSLGEDTSLFRGNVRIFEWLDGAWQQVGGSILGDDLIGESWFGYATAMSADGRRIAASAPLAFPNYVASYELPY
ncbi:hypothetical protein FisN_6Lh289 [Fistulifera solaris]|uniref:Bulb-type lectin domain-containing protein n=1 Tax=Fistulifera solaris TaxID=1519565 RepID=A0A1Z5J608_FISSO|nr:hypothetical protein FisN_6Lh289 [Fistulifera solaris]|eukprot:GAX09342.1 hypothetical protein FisN_6Lh289 [Fistulifera solaris]